MIIKKVSFLNIRKTTEAHLSFIPETTIITGINGAGKTTIIEAVFLLCTTKSFRKKQNKALTQKGKKRLEVQGVFEEKKTIKTIKILTEKQKKIITKNNTPVKKTSTLLQENPMVCMSPEETDIIESYKAEKMQYFDKIIFKTNPQHIKHIKEYRKLLQYRNFLLENKGETKPWDKKLSESGLLVWKTRKQFFKEIIEAFQKVQSKIKTEKYNIEYIYKETKTTEDYEQKLQHTNNQEKTNIGPHKDTTIFKIKNKNLQEHGSQGEKKLFKYILKLAEAEIIKKKTHTTPILLLDDFFAKLDSENIMKIFIYFHCKFQTIITTTETNKNTIKSILKTSEKKIKIIQCQ